MLFRGLGLGLRLRALESLDVKVDIVMDAQSCYLAPVWESEILSTLLVGGGCECCTECGTIVFALHGRTRGGNY